MQVQSLGREDPLNGNPLHLVRRPGLCLTNWAGGPEAGSTGLTSEPPLGLSLLHLSVAPAPLVTRQGRRILPGPWLSHSLDRAWDDQGGPQGAADASDEEETENLEDIHGPRSTEQGGAHACRMT